MVNKITLQRLAFIKYLYNSATAQSHMPEPLCSASILMFHDSIELFLQLAVEHLNIKTKGKDTKFSEYWDLLSSNLPLGYPTQKESMLRLNGSRVQLKHHGTRPCKADIEGFRVNATDFFKENTHPIFGMDFNDISLISMVQYEDARKNLEKAAKLIEKSDRKGAIEKIARAFSEIIFDYEDRKQTKLMKSPFFIGGNLASGKLALNQINRQEIWEVLNDIINSVGSIQNAFRIMALGIDFRRYTKFSLLTPLVIKTKKIETIFENKDYTSEPPSMEDCRFCLDFVVEAAIILQEFDYTIDN